MQNPTRLVFAVASGNPKDRAAPFTPKLGDRLVVLARDRAADERPERLGPERPRLLLAGRALTAPFPASGEQLQGSLIGERPASLGR